MRNLFYSLLFIIFNNNNFSYSSTNFALLIPDAGIDPLTLQQGSFERNLLESYNNMRGYYSFSELKQRAKLFNLAIARPIIMNAVADQTQSIQILRTLHEKLENVNSVIRSYFAGHTEEIDNRIDLARLDQQRFTTEARCGVFNHLDISTNARKSLNKVVGKIFQITQEKGKSEDVMDIGSAIMIRIISGKPVTVRSGTLLNGVMTCAHVFEADEDEHLTGIFFVANKHLDPRTGLPSLNTVNNKHDLIVYLRTNPQSFEIDSYNTKRRISGSFPSIIVNNNLHATKPQYWDNEDIVFGNFKSATYNYTSGVKINFDIVADDNPSLVIHRKSKRYFTAGYPGCWQYNKMIFQGDHNFDLIKKLGLSPLFISSALPKIKGDKVRKPRLDDGIILYEAPTAKGMSGGPIFRAYRDNNIKILGCITSGIDGKEYGCY